VFWLLTLAPESSAEARNPPGTGSWLLVGSMSCSSTAEDVG